MRCLYQFNIKGRLRLESCFPISWEGFEYDFVCDENGVIRRLDVTVEVLSKLDWPSIIPHPQQGVSAHLNFPAPSFPILKKQIRAIEGLMSLYGLEEIDIEHFKQVWLPENEQEKNELSVSSYEKNRSIRPANELMPVPFDLIAKLVLSAKQSSGIEIALGFYRKGRQDIKEERFIEGFYDFYFMIETLYGNGKFKTNSVVSEFTNNAVLNQQIEKVKADNFFLSSLNREPKQAARAREKYVSQTVEKILMHIVELRGYLHHHSSSRHGIWHPDDHQAYKADATFMQLLCHEIAFLISEPIVFSKKSLVEFSVVESKGRTRMQRFKVKNSK